MKPARVKQMAAAVIALLLGASDGAAQRWEWSEGPDVAWAGLACSADSRRLWGAAWSARTHHRIFSSTTWGATWITNSVSVGDAPMDLACSGDGHSLTGGTIHWFVNTFGVLLPFPAPAWFSLAGQLPLLAVAVLLGTGTLKALFYTGDINRPFVFSPVFYGSWLLVELSPLVVLGLLLRQRMRVGKDVTAGKLVRSRILIAFIPAAVCVWTAVHLCSEYFWNPAGSNVASWSSIVGNYFSTFRWLWPAGLALLILWLAPRRATQTHGHAAALD